MKNRLVPCILLVVLLVGCANNYRTAKTPLGTDVQLPNCRNYVSQYANINIRWDILKNYRGEINISAGVENSLEHLEKFYTLQAENLCEMAPTYISSGESGQYFCRSERLSHSVLEIETINGILVSINGIEDAKEKSERIKQLIDNFSNQTLKQLDEPCSISPQAIFSTETERLHEKITGIYIRIHESINDYLKRSAAHKPYNQNEIQLLESKVNFLRSEFIINEGKLAELEKRQPRTIDLRFELPPAAPTNFGIR